MARSPRATSASAAVPQVPGSRKACSSASSPPVIPPLLSPNTADQRRRGILPCAVRCIRLFACTLIAREGMHPKVLVETVVVLAAGSLSLGSHKVAHKADSARSFRAPVPLCSWDRGSLPARARAENHGVVDLAAVIRRPAYGGPLPGRVDGEELDLTLPRPSFIRRELGSKHAHVRDPVNTRPGLVLRLNTIGCAEDDMHITDVALWDDMDLRVSMATAAR
jgi:hypothetical protein